LSNTVSRWSQKKVPAGREREERFRRLRAEAPALRSACPSATRVNVELEFLPGTQPPHASQSFTLYPAASALFLYPCPYGDCNGIYDLTAEATRTLVREKASVAGTVTCSGSRSRDGQPQQPCGLDVHYTISVRHEAAK
jgi:hypothetical protein